MKISYNWLKDYLPQEISSEWKNNTQTLSDILTSVGLEVESLEEYHEIGNNLKNIIIGEVLTCEKHPDADKLKITTVDNGKGETLQIVCGASNVAVGQKVVVAEVGAKLYPVKGEPFIIKKSKIRGIESEGMLCAEDEIGLGENHDGIIVLPENIKAGTAAFNYYKLYSDWIFEIGLTPNRMNAMSHIGVAKDVCAYLSYHNKKEIQFVSPFKNNFKPDNTSQKMEVTIENPEACSRYAGITIKNIKIASSPAWMQNKLQSIGVRPINNIVDITNFILHETGQPLHAFDADKIKAQKIIVKTLPENTSFTTLDEKVRKLNHEDLMICDGNEKPMCFGGVFGGIESGVTENTSTIFLESAWFNPVFIRRTSYRHNLRTEAAIHFEKGVDISNTVNVLKRAALLIKEICGGEIASEIIDVYPSPKKQTEIILQNSYLKKISGKSYRHAAIKNILESLNFSIIKENEDELTVAVPFSNPDITLPSDVIEEILRIDGLDNIEIPSVIKMAPVIETGVYGASLKEKISGWLTGNGFSEIFTNSITNSKYFEEKNLKHSVKIINSLSEELDIMRPSMIPTGLESISYNLNRKNSNLLFFEFGKIYSSEKPGKYSEEENLALYFSGNKKEISWKNVEEKIDIYFVKGICDTILKITGQANYRFSTEQQHSILDEYLVVTINEDVIAEAGRINKKKLDQFSIKQPVFFLYIDWKKIVARSMNKEIFFKEIPKFPQVQRDLSVIVDKAVRYQSLEDSIESLKLSRLKSLSLFDVFENEKLGKDKKSLAISFTFSDKEKTLTDDETENMMAQIIRVIQNNHSAEIRKNN